MPTESTPNRPPPIAFHLVQEALLDVVLLNDSTKLKGLNPKQPIQIPNNWYAEKASPTDPPITDPYLNKLRERSTYFTVQSYVTRVVFTASSQAGRRVFMFGNIENYYRAKKESIQQKIKEGYLPAKIEIWPTALSTSIRLPLKHTSFAQLAALLPYVQEHSLLKSTIASRLLAGQLRKFGNQKDPEKYHSHPAIQFFSKLPIEPEVVLEELLKERVNPYTGRSVVLRLTLPTQRALKFTFDICSDKDTALRKISAKFNLSFHELVALAQGLPLTDKTPKQND